MGMIPINSFSGVHSSLGNPAIGTAQSVKSLIRNRTRGWLELPDGYAQKYAVPVADAYNTVIVGKDIANFYVAEHGGRAISVFVGTYTKVSRYSSGVTLPRFGVWMRPYWSGAAWVDDWLELTEIEIVQLTSLSSVSTLNFADTGKAADYFKNWIVVFEDHTQAQDTDNYFLIQSSTASSVTYFGANASLTNATRIAGAKMILCRSFLNKDLPATISSYIFNYLNEIRMTTGNASTDLSLMAGYRKKDYSWATSDASMDRIVLDVGCLDTWRYALLLNSITAPVELTSPLAAGNYAFKIAAGTDDNQIAVARDVSLLASDSMAIEKNIGSAGYVIGTDDNYIYRINAVNTKLLNRYKIDDYTVPAIPQLRIIDEGWVSYFSDMVIMGGSAYILWATPSTNPGYLLYCTRIDLATFTVTSVIQCIGAYGPDVHTGKLTTDGTYLYCISAAWGDNIHVFDIMKYTADLTLVTKVYFAPADHGDLVQDIDSCCYYGGYIFAVSRAATKTSWFMRCDTNLANPVYLDRGSTNIPIPSMVVGPDAMLYNTVCESGLKIERRNLGLILSDTWNIATASSGRLASDGTHLYAHVTYSGSYVVMKGVDVAANEYLSQIVITNTTVNMLFGTTFLYGDGFILNLVPTAYSITTDGTQRIDFRLLASAGAIPARMRYAYLYISKDAGPFYRLLKIDLTVVTNIDTGEVTQETWDADAYYDANAKHFYHRTEVKSIRETDYEAIGAEISTDMGRSYAQSGIVKYKVGGVVGRKTYVGNFYDNYSAQSFRNKVLVNCVSGDGNQQIDVFDYMDPIDVEYGDGDEINAISDSNERILVGKKRCNVLLTLSGGEYEREIVSRGIGNCSAKGTVSFDDVVYFPDYNGLNSFSTHSGLRVLNETWIETWKAYTDAQKEAAISVIDRVNKCWIICIGSDIWQYDLSEKNQWMLLGYTDLPVAIRQNMEGFIDYLIARTEVITGKIVTVQPSLTLADRFNGANYSFFWKSNKMQLLKQEIGFVIDALILGIIIEYDTSFAFQMKLYLDDLATAVQTINIPVGKHKFTIQAPLGCRCKAPVVEILGTTVAANDYIKIKSLQLYTDAAARGDVVLQ